MKRPKNQASALHELLHTVKPDKYVIMCVSDLNLFSYSSQLQNLGLLSTEQMQKQQLKDKNSQ